MVVLLSSVKKFSVVCLLILLSQTVRAEILFEGWSKVLVGGTHAGYVVQRYEFDPKSKDFLCTYYLKTNALGGNVTESVKARATKALKPISYQYTEVSGDKSKVIDATFKGDTMVGVIKEGTKTSKIQKAVPKGAFLSSFLVYLMLQSKEGIKTGVKYNYMAVAEEDGGIYPGETFVSDSETVNGVGAFKVLNTFKDVRFISYVTAKGDIIGTKSPVLGIATELVPTMQLATAGMGFNSSNISLLFGTLPLGAENTISKKAGTAVNIAPEKEKVLTATPTPTADGSGKKSGVPGGQGIVIKGQPATAAPSAESERHLPAEGPAEGK